MFFFNMIYLVICTLEIEVLYSKWISDDPNHKSDTLLKNLYFSADLNLKWLLQFSGGPQSRYCWIQLEYKWLQSLANIIKKMVTETYL